MSLGGVRGFGGSNIGDLGDREGVVGVVGESGDAAVGDGSAVLAAPVPRDLEVVQGSALQIALGPGQLHGAGDVRSGGQARRCQRGAFDHQRNLPRDLSGCVPRGVGCGVVDHDGSDVGGCHGQVGAADRDLGLSLPCGSAADRDGPALIGERVRDGGGEVEDLRLADTTIGVGEFRGGHEGPRGAHHGDGNLHLQGVGFPVVYPDHDLSRSAEWSLGGGGDPHLLPGDLHVQRSWSGDQRIGHRLLVSGVGVLDHVAQLDGGGLLPFGHLNR